MLLLYGFIWHTEIIHLAATGQQHWSAVNPTTLAASSHIHFTQRTSNLPLYNPIDLIHPSYMKGFEDAACPWQPVCVSLVKIGIFHVQENILIHIWEWIFHLQSCSGLE